MLPIGAGDVITTRKNDSNLGVANRQTWTVQSIGADGTVWALDAASPRKHPRSVALPSWYVTDHAHLAYAATAYGVQGVTTTSAHTLLSETLDASGVYVGMTRGRDANVLHIVADTLDNARDQFIDALQLDRADRGLQAATSGAHVAVAGLVSEGPVKVVNDERARLVEAIANADPEAARWEHAAGLVATQAEPHAREEASGRDAHVIAEAHSAALLDAAVRRLRAQAIVDGQVYLDAQIRQDAARDANRSSGRLGRRAVQRRLDTAQAGTQDAQATVLIRWGSVPATGRWAATTRDGLEAWAARVTHQRAHDKPDVRVLARMSRAPMKSSGRPGGGTDPTLKSSPSRSTVDATPPLSEPSAVPTVPTLVRNDGSSTPTRRAPTSPRSNPSRSDEPCTSSSHAALEPSRSRLSEQPPPTESGAACRRNAASDQQTPSADSACSPAAGVARAVPPRAPANDLSCRCACARELPRNRGSATNPSV